MITESIIKKIAPSANKAFLKPMVEAMNDLLPGYGINTSLRMAHFLAQAAHESDGFKTMQEYASGAAYEGRKDLGNVKKGDGKRYKGRGIFQLTGRANYRKIGEKLGLPLEAKPELAAVPLNAVLIACEYWDARKLNALADKDDVRAITRKINGGYNGLADRIAYLARCKKALGASVAPLLAEGGLDTPRPEIMPSAPPAEVSEPIVEPAADTDPLIGPTSSSEMIQMVEKLLEERNYDPGNVDGKWDDLTATAILSLKFNNKLPEPGVPTIRLSDAKAAPVWVIVDRQGATEETLRKQGSETIKATDKTSWWSKLTLGLVGAPAIAEKTGALDAAKNAVDQGSVWRSMIEDASSIITWLLANLWIAVPVIAAFTAFIVIPKIVAKRVREHQIAKTQ